MIAAQRQEDVMRTTRGPAVARRALLTLLQGFPRCVDCGEIVLGHTRDGCPDACALHCSCWESTSVSFADDCFEDAYLNQGEEEPSVAQVYAYALGATPGSVNAMDTGTHIFVDMAALDAPHSLYKVRDAGGTWLLVAPN